MMRLETLEKPAFTSTQLLMTLFVISVVVLGTAWAFELIGGYAPCPLCLKQRWAYYFAIPASVVALLVLQFYSSRIALFVVALIGAAYLYNSGLGFYHAGIEWQFWDGPPECAGALGDTGVNLIDRIQSQRFVLCNEAPWRFLGLSFAGYNMLISAGLAFLCALSVFSLKKSTS